MSESRILGADGHPIKKAALVEEVAMPTLTGVRQAWMTDSVASSLTPFRLARVLQAANEGSDYEYLTLAEEMEEREWHYQSVIGTRKRAVDGLDLKVEAASESAEDVAIADALRVEVGRATFEDAISDYLDGIGKGRSSVEIMWKPGKQWTVDEFVWRDPRYFQWAEDNPHELRIRDESDLRNGIALPQYRFINHVPKLKTGIPVRSGLARVAAAAYMCKSFTLRDWMSFVELFGMPLRVGKYGAGAGDKEKAILRTALANLGSDAAAMIPDSMKVEFIERKASGSSHAIFKDIAEWLDRGISKAVLGQTASTEGTPGKLGNESAQDEVRDDIKRADAKQLGRTLTRDFARAFVDINFGTDKACPKIVVFVPDNEDLQTLKDALSALVPLGLRVSQTEIRNKFGLSEPADEDDLLKQEALTADTPSVTRKANNQQQAHVTGCQCDGCSGVALNRYAQAQNADAVDDLVDDAMSDWEQVAAPMINPVQALADECETADEFRARLPELLGMMDSGALIEHLANASYIARGVGNVGE